MRMEAETGKAERPYCPPSLSFYPSPPIGPVAHAEGRTAAALKGGGIRAKCLDCWCKWARRVRDVNATDRTIPACRGLNLLLYSLAVWQKRTKSLLLIRTYFSKPSVLFFEGHLTQRSSIPLGLDMKA